MTRAEAVPSSIAEAARDKHSRSQPAGSSGPAKDSVSHPNGAAALGAEIGAEGDARRERLDAIAQGDQLPPVSTVRGSSGQLGLGQLGLGQQNGAEQGMQDRSEGQREQLQAKRNNEFNSEQPDLLNIARTSGGNASTNPTTAQTKITSTGNTNPTNLLAQASTSAGQQSGTSAYDGEVSRDAPTNA